jgi:nicotinamidase/pyrazinamidase
MDITAQDALLVIDVQNDFCPGGALAVENGDQVVDAIHFVATKFQHIVLTQDWHPSGHSSFASAHEGWRPFESIETAHGAQVLWPDHCVQGSRGAALHSRLQLPQAELILRKGFRKDIDSYSAFFENDRSTPTGLFGYLQERGINRVFLAGLAYDYCVGFSALDARRLGLSAFIYGQACRSIDRNESVERMNRELDRAGVIVL